MDTKDGHNIYVIMKAMCPHHNGYVATHALGHVMQLTHGADTQKLNKTKKKAHKTIQKRNIAKKSTYLKSKRN